jgi:DHA1 family tetracycline resistance protein-like MFS transporter
LYVVVFVGFLGYSLMITVFTPMLLLDDNRMLPASSSAATRSIVLGLLLCLYPLGQFVGAPVLGALSDRVGRRPVLLGSLAASTVWYGVIGAALVAHSLPLLMAASFLGGLGEANISIAQSSIADSTSTADRNRLFGYVYLSSSLAYVVGPLAGGQLANRHLASWFGYPTPFFVVGGLLALTLLGVALFFSESRRPSEKVTGGYLKSFTNLATVITDRRLRPLYLVNFLLYLAIFGFFRVYPMYLVRDFHLGVARESVFVAWVAVPIVVANLWLVGRLSRRWSAAVLTLASGVATGVLLVILPFPGVLDLLWLTLGLTALALAICLPSCATVLSLSVGDAEQGQVMGNNQSLQVGAEAFSGVVGGVAAAAFIELPFVLFGAAALLGASRLWRARAIEPTAAG